MQKTAVICGCGSMAKGWLKAISGHKDLASRVRIVGLVEQPAQEDPEPLGVCGQFLDVVRVRVAVERDDQSGSVGTGVDVEREVFDETGRDVAHRTWRAVEPQAVVERHDVRRRAEQLAFVVEQAEVAAQLFVAVAVVATAAWGCGDASPVSRCRRVHASRSAVRAAL